VGRGANGGNGKTVPGKKEGGGVREIGFSLGGLAFAGSGGEKGYWGCLIGAEKEGGEVGRRRKRGGGGEKGGVGWGGGITRKIEGKKQYRKRKTGGKLKRQGRTSGGGRVGCNQFHLPRENQTQ